MDMLLRSLSMSKGQTYDSPTKRPTQKYDSLLSRSGSADSQPSNSTTSQSRKRNPNLLEQIPTIKRKLSTNIFLLVPLIFTVSLLGGTIFYRVHHGWELSTSFYYSSQVLAGDPFSSFVHLMIRTFASLFTRLFRTYDRDRSVWNRISFSMNCKDNAVD